ncbi:MAG TPA: hypothetical protein VL832_23920, partial [Puia sp.]|nr:hypothetical protein [Puia sp.]
STHLKDGSALRLTQQTDYPWDGKITLSLQETPARPFSIFLRIPGWCMGASLLVNGKRVIGINGSPAPSSAGSPATGLIPGEYTAIHRRWKTGDKIELMLPMPVVLSVANPLVEETRNQVAVRRGPIVYCLESPDLPPGTNLFNVAMPAHPHLVAVAARIGNTRIMSLQGKAKLLPTTHWENKLYQNLSPAPATDIPVRLVPYYAWANRGSSDMTVWMPVVQ